MKKTFRNAIALLLAIVIACGSLTAFAQTPGDIEWYFGDDEPWIYSYAGALTVGEDTVLPPVSEVKSVYLTIEIEESGYYKITVDSDVWYGMQRKNDDGIYEDIIDYMIKEYGMPSYYYLEEGEYIIGLDLYEEKGVKVSAEYVGEVAAFEFDRTELENMILGYDIFEGDESPYIFELFGLTVEFSLGEKKIFDFVTVCVYPEKQLVKGENTVEIGLYGAPYREEVTVSIIEITDIIESVEVTNFKDYAYITKYYNGNIYAPRMDGETVTVTYTDGSTETLEDFGGLDYLENGYPVNVYYEEAEDGWIVVVCVANQVMAQEECAVYSASVSENLLEYKDNVVSGIQYIISWSSSYFTDVFSAASAGEAISLLINAIRSTISDIIYIFGDIFGQTADLFGSLI